MQLYIICIEIKFKMEKKTSDTLFVILFIGTFIFMAFVVYYMLTNVQAITKSPFVFGAKKMGNVECSCVQYHEQGQPSYFFFNDTTLTSGMGKSIISDINIEDIENTTLIIVETNTTKTTEVITTVINETTINTTEINITNTTIQINSTQVNISDANLSVLNNTAINIINSTTIDTNISNSSNMNITNSSV